LGNVPSNKDVIAGVISSFLQIEEFEYSPSEPVSLGVKLNYREPPKEFYQEAFESRFLASTEEYYSGLAQKLLADLTCSKYMEAVIEALEAEERRSATYVSQSTVSKFKAFLVSNEVMFTI
ncbi:unnamed protein product, partial [Cylicostephanus goldi]